ncbi:hypothetical protein BCR33DRAFT_16021 [Rhizoclosmatium globosum]|uniref:Uncharacterized protein n=1 Tax=Rhizoclosmatium globosum TaxID=329046 RepID=A0A1Y2CRM1_9FUNG|nr:hypothetical protein BCR33DRAFT_16021 [Rhizoclosmatium globosum]|eukprot:ORY49005.1 hypothetical protein BCR33DRAFT_16021 [Rhizoclosmatium globosum]
MRHGVLRACRTWMAMMCWGSCLDVVDNDTDVQMDDASETRGVETPSHRTEAGDPRSDTRRKAPGPHRSDGVMRLSRSSTPQLNNEIESTGSISGISDTLFESDDSSDASQSHFLVAKDSDTWQNSSGDHSTQVDQDLLHSDFMLIFGHQL